MKIGDSELILNKDGSIYHLNLLPGELGDWIITVGDQDRVEKVSQYFDSIDIRKQKREFKTHTGNYKGKRISVISTGIGPDNIDIVLNELDALVNIDFESRSVKEEKKSLKIVRVGTSGALQPDIPVNSIVSSDIGIGFDNLLHFYANLEDINDTPFSNAFIAHTKWNERNSLPYVIHGDETLKAHFKHDNILAGVTTTNVGFYGPQGRILRLAVQDEEMNERLASFTYEGHRITNLEMETAAIYGMAKLLGHKALSLNVILANRANATFSSDPASAVDNLIRKTLELIAL